MPHEWLQTTKTTYARAANGLGTTLGQLGIVGPDAPSRDRRLAHWAFSLTCVHDAEAMARLEVPWWTYRAIDIVEAWLAAQGGGARVFEYGSGASTLWLADRAHEVVSVEHDTRFAEVIQPRLEQRDNIRFSLVEPVPTSNPTIASDKEGWSGFDFSAYVSALEAVPGSFSLIVIDGRARQACLAVAASRLAPGGMVVFDNTRRRRYRQAITASGLAERRLPGLTPTLPYPDQTSLLAPPGTRGFSFGESGCVGEPSCVGEPR